jgi:DNA-binding NtrC family response regulator
MEAQILLPKLIALPQKYAFEALDNVAREYSSTFNPNEGVVNYEDMNCHERLTFYEKFYSKLLNQALEKDSPFVGWYPTFQKTLGLVRKALASGSAYLQMTEKDLVQSKEARINDTFNKYIAFVYGDIEKAEKRAGYAELKVALGYWEHQVAEAPVSHRSIELIIELTTGRLAERKELLEKLQRLCTLQDRELEKIESEYLENKIELGHSPGMKKVQEILSRLALKPKATLLITGETGTGKEVVAAELHRVTHSERMPFLALNCASIPTELFESELYGHEKGSFSGAHKTRIGLAEAVREGTLFLDEIGELDPRHQAKLLRLLQERKFRRVGSNIELKFKGRIISATHRNLKKRIEEGFFREDLFYRLSTVDVYLPALRERGEDIFLIADFLCKKHKVDPLNQERLTEIQHYSWPGNIRELNNWIERASILGHFDNLHPQNSPNKDFNTGAMVHYTEGNIKDRRTQILDYYDKVWIEKALFKHKGNISAAADELGIDRKNLSRRIKELEITSDIKEAA